MDIIFNAKETWTRNIVGTFNKWLTDTMDNVNRNTINKHFESLNSKNLDLSSSLNE